jgi:hypothetical protein
VLHVVGIPLKGADIWHTIRHTDGTWEPFRNVEGQTGDMGYFTTISTTSVAGELHVVGGTSDGQLWHTVRHANWQWEPFRNAEKQAGERGNFAALATAALTA